MTPLTLKSPAKLNLFLRIIGRRPDGYHELASLFQAIDLFDTIEFSLSDSDRLTCTDSSIPTDNSNLVLKAADLFRRKTGLKFGLKIHLTKKIPHQAGLGGGSSNAATTLWACNQLLGNPASLSDLISWSSEIGSDISFFLSQGTAYCTGRGDKVETLPKLPFSPPLWIVKPQKGLSTPEVYRRLDVQSLQKRDPKVSLSNFFLGKPDYFNDLEEPAFSAMQELQSIKQSLHNQKFETVLLSGSGSSLFCIGDSKPIVDPAIKIIRASFVTRNGGEWYFQG